jgi:hypothetical protein
MFFETFNSIWAMKMRLLIGLVWFFRIVALVFVSPIILFIGFLHLLNRYLPALFGKTFTIEDKIFGTILFVADDGNPYWETGEIYFEATNSVITLLIEASKKGPTIKQKDFYKNIETNYSHYFDTIFYPFIESEVKEFFFNHTQISSEDLKTSFVVDSITIPRFRGIYFSWDITFVTQYDVHYFTIELKNWRPLNLQING